MSEDAKAVANRRASGRPSRRFVLVAFSLVALGVPLATLLAFMQVRALEVRAREIVDDMLTSVRLVGQLENQVQKQQNLLDEHLFAKDPAEMTRLEATLSALDKQMAATTHVYEPWASLPDERTVWHQTRADLMLLGQPIARALALSRVNRDVEAQQVMKLVAGQFAVVGADFDKLISINDRGAAATLAQFSRIQLRLSLTLLGLGLITLLGTVFVGRWAARQVGRREDEAARETKILEDQNRELDAFAARVAHDIRNPLMTISLAVTQISREVPAGSRAPELLRRGVRRMDTLVEDLLTLARIETLARGVCDPAKVAVQIQEEFAARVDGEQGRLRVAVDHAAVSCSEGLLHQALANLTENAVKYRRQDIKPEVEILGTAVDDGYDLRVSDNGVGMAADEASRVFEPFFRSPRTQNLPGTGLGLSIVNRVAQASSGTLSLTTRLGQGSTFILHLPLAGGAHA